MNSQFRIFRAENLFFMVFLIDLVYSFLQFYYTPLDGDIAGGVILTEELKKILSDPFGISVITQDAHYPNPNRFFAHQFFYTYFNTLPIFLQKFLTPIDSVYLSCAIAKVLIQLGFVFILFKYLKNLILLESNKIWLVSVLIVPLFQTNGYRTYMGIIDPSITYTFFYALPLLLLLILYYPIFFSYKYGKPITWYKFILVCFFSIVVIFNGPLNAGIVAITSCLSLIYLLWYKRQESRHKVYVTLSALLLVFSLYCLYIGLNNSIFSENQISVMQRYERLPMGLFNILFSKLGFPILIAMIFVNIYIINKYFNANMQKRNIFWLILKCVSIFSLIYILALPLGGYKTYRENIIRYDTFMPITIAIIFVYIVSSLIVLQTVTNSFRKSYIIILAIVSIIFTVADNPEFDKNDCERSALTTLSKSLDSVVALNSNCTIVDWTKCSDPLKSTRNAQLLWHWNITNKLTLYYQK
jgi:hypothetical protein